MYVQKIIKHFEVQQKLIWSFTSLNLSNEVDIFQSFSTKSPVCVSPDSLSLRTTTQRWNFVLKYLSLENAHLICLTQTAEVSCYLQQGFVNVFFCTEERIWIVIPITYIEITVKKKSYEQEEQQQLLIISSVYMWICERLGCLGQPFTCSGPDKHISQVD